MADLQPLVEAGARNSTADLKMLQAIHDHAVGLGAKCGADPDEAMEAEESAVTAQPSSLRLVEAAATTEVIALREARADYEIKLISPGKGSSAYYPAAVLERDGPKVFRAGTHVYLNHPTAAEEAARPEGDVKNLAGVLATDAVYHEAHAKGPGLYARMKVFADHAQTVEEKAPHVGMSIRASGNAESNRQHDGLPVLRELTSAESVDVVTKAGRGGLILTEAARAAHQEEESMADTAEVKQLREAVAATEATNRRLLERAIKADAREEGMRILESVSLPQAAKVRVVEACAATPPVADGELDKVKFAEAINAAAAKEARYLSEVAPAGRVTGMGTAAAVDPVKESAAIAAREAEDTKLRESGVAVFARLTGSKTAAEAAMRKGAA